MKGSTTNKIGLAYFLNFAVQYRVYCAGDIVWTTMQIVESKDLFSILMLTYLII